MKGILPPRKAATAISSAAFSAIGAFPRRLLVANEDWGAACRALSGAGLSASLIDEGDLQA